MINPGSLYPDKTFIPLETVPGEELFINGIFEFNITRMIEYVMRNPALFIPEDVQISDYHISYSSINENYMDTVTIGVPVILAEIAPDQYNLIDGNHRMEKARRLGYKTITAYKLYSHQHIVFLTSRKSYDTYIEYWNSKLDLA